MLKRRQILPRSRSKQHKARKQVVCFVKYFDSEFRGNTVRKYPILKLYTEEEVIKARQVAVGAFTETSAPSQLVGSGVGTSSGDIQAAFQPNNKRNSFGN